MFGVERRSRIMSLLNEKKSLLVQETADLFSVTEETIRRDLKELESQGLLTRTHGGAVLADDIKAEAPINVREGINTAGKDLIGKKAAELVKDGDTVLLDASTSSLYLAKHLKGKRGLTVITNAQKIIFELSDCEDITLISTGGIVRSKSLSCVGRTAENAVRDCHADKVFFSCKGFSPRRGLTDANEQESDLRKLMLKCSEQAVFLCDRTKFDKVGYIATAGLDEIDWFVTDSELPEGWRQEIEGHGVKIMTPGI